MGWNHQRGWHAHREARRQRRDAQRDLADELRARGEEVAQMALDHARNKLKGKGKRELTPEERAHK